MIAAVERRRIIVRGVVQGVGFRPFVYGLAERCGVTGWVNNTGAGVIIEAEGPPAALGAFAAALTAEAPPLAVIEACEQLPLAPLGEQTFTIRHSAPQPGTHTLVSPDLCTCDACLHELADPTDRRYQYPFINCTHCGPRFTITRDLPYDRPLTTMADFPLCPACATEYADPRSRRFHAQPIACPDCGPTLWLETNGAVTHQHADALAAAAALIRDGGIVAVKGLGGFHLACDAANPAAIAELYRRKSREAGKPLAVMCADVTAAHALAFLSPAAIAALTSRARPIVLLTPRPDTPIGELTAPGVHQIGLLLPYTPLHTLLLAAIDRPIVLTSANLSGQPIVYTNEAARRDLAPLADALLLHDRAIEQPCDDSVIALDPDGGELPIRRSRGYAPFPVRLAHAVPPILAVGGELKNTFCLTHGDHAFLSQYLGDLGTLETQAAFERALAHFERLFRAAPKLIVGDRHPRYQSAAWGRAEAARRGIPWLAVQHHHAHLVSVLAEHQHTHGHVIGVCCDGTGYGDDGAIWGGEILIAAAAGWQRIGHLGYLPLAGGDALVKSPARIALGYLQASGLPWTDDLPPVRGLPATERRVIQQVNERGIGSVPTSSMGRLFDAASALIGAALVSRYEGEAALKLSALADSWPLEPGYPLPIMVQPDGTFTLDPHPLLAALTSAVRRATEPGRMAAAFQRGVADGLIAAVVQARMLTGITTAVLSGGVFQNRWLLGAVRVGLTAAGFTVLTHRRVPPNDGGLALGQAAIAAASLQAEATTLISESA